MSAPEPKRCLGCGYILEHLPEPRCPECGREFDLRWPESCFVGKPPRHGAGHLLLAALAPPVFVLLGWSFGRAGLGMGSVFLSTCLSMAVEFYVAARSRHELLKPVCEQPRRVYWRLALAVSLLVVFGWCALGAAMFYGREVGQNNAPPFTIVAIPDTQYYSASYPATFEAQTQWIVNNRTALNIAYVAHEGDIVDDSSQTTRWTNANAAISILDTLPDLPYGLCVGNHDENPNGDPNGTTAFNTWFPYTRYQTRPWYGGHYGTNNDNHYILFSAGGMDFIAIHLEFGYGSDAGVLTWAEGLLQANPNRRAIVSEHDILNVGTPASWTAQGQPIYDALKDNPNLFLILCGHNHGEGSRVDVYNGHTVYSLLADYQSDPNGGNGYLRTMEFVPASNEIRVKTYSPTLGTYMTDADSQFTLSYDMGGVSFTELGTVSGVASGSNATFPWTGLDIDATHEWYATVTDGYRTVAGR
jgi:hypothetical protein